MIGALRMFVGMVSSPLTYSQVVLADTPTIYWKFNEASGTSATDSSGNGLTLTLTNTPTFGTTAIVDPDTSCRFTRASAEYGARTVNNVMDVGSSVTYEFWCRPKSTGVLQTIQQCDLTYDSNIFLTSANKIQFNTAAASPTTTYSYAVDTVFHCACVADYQNATQYIARVYINGTQDVESALVTRVVGGGAGNVYFFGKHSVAGRELDAEVAHYAAYPRALSATEILEHYNAGI